MTRLLHAAARGARIQAKFDKWETEKFVMVQDLQDPRYDYRIHPEDEHLQYGPISSALRYEAEHYPDKHYRYGKYTSAAVVANAADSDWDLPAKDRDIPLFLLILAEALADEGM